MSINYYDYPIQASISVTFNSSKLSNKFRRKILKANKRISSRTQKEAKERLLKTDELDILNIYEGFFYGTSPETIILNEKKTEIKEVKLNLFHDKINIVNSINIIKKELNNICGPFKKYFLKKNKFKIEIEPKIPNVDKFVKKNFKTILWESIKKHIFTLILASVLYVILKLFDVLRNTKFLTTRDSLYIIAILITILFCAIIDVCIELRRNKYVLEIGK